jgi:hypothetical protein
MVVVLILPLNGIAGQSCGQVPMLSPAPQTPSPQREAGNGPVVPVEVGWLQETSMNKQLKARIRKRLILSSTCKQLM